MGALVTPEFGAAMIYAALQRRGQSAGLSSNNAALGNQEGDCGAPAIAPHQQTTHCHCSEAGKWEVWFNPRSLAMQALPRHDRATLGAAILAITICCGLADPRPAASARSLPATPISLEMDHALQGMTFVGSLAIEGETVQAGDVLTFENGLFSSQTCAGYGFPAAPYWVRRDSDGLHFRATLQSPENGEISFEGVFDGEQMHATAHWTKERWYWTVEQKIEFAGRPMEQPE